MTLDDFKKKLKSGSYTSGTNARRAVGRLDFSDQDRKTATSAITRRFGSAPVTKTTRSAAKTVKKAPAKRTKK